MFQPNEDDCKTKLTELDTDCLLLILERLHFHELINVAEINEEFAVLAVNVFRRIYSRSQLVIRVKLPFPNNADDFWKAIGIKTNDESIKKWNEDIRIIDENPLETDQIDLIDSKQVLNAFKHFGHLIRRLKFISFSSMENLQGKLIGRLINKYSSQSLTDIECEGSNVLELIRKPLINVENATFKHLNRNLNKAIRFVELFPSVRRLELDSLTDYSISYFDYHIPNLKHLAMKRYEFEYRRVPLPEIFMTNPQMRSLTLHGAYLEFLQKVNKFVPRLEILELSDFKPKAEGNIRFRNVNSLTLRDGSTTSPANLHFPRLQNLHIFNLKRNAYINDYITFLNAHSHLRQLYLEFNEPHDLVFQRLTANLTDLAEMTIGNVHEPQELQTNLVVDFLRGHDQMMRFNAINFGDNWNLELQNRLMNEWDITFGERSISCERKTNDQYQIRNNQHHLQR